MLQELFVGFAPDDVQDHLDRIARVLNLCHTSLDQCSKVSSQGRYYLIRLPEAVSTEVEADIKARLLSGEFDFDVLFSAHFPVFAPAAATAAAAAAAAVASGADAAAAAAADVCAPGALVMDMDMTTVQIEGIDEIARRLGVFDEVAAITHGAMHGKLEFSESLQRRVALLKGGDAAQVLAAVKEIMAETSGLDVLLNYCNKLKPHTGFKTCIASGGFHELIGEIDKKYGLDRIAANRFQLDEAGRFVGKVDGPIVDGKAKAALVASLKQDDGISQERILVLGDGANDLLMMAEGGLGIAYHAKPKVQEQARNMLNHCDLSAVAALLDLSWQLYQQGMR